MEKHRILLDDAWIDYDLVYKNIKSVYFRVEKGKLVVKAPYDTPLFFIENNIIKYSERLLKQMSDYQSYASYKPNGYVMIYNQKYRIILRDVGHKICQIHQKQMYVYSQDIQKIIENYLKKLLKDYIEERIIAYLARDFDLDMPKIEIKKYKGRWGSCFYKDKRVSFNLSLVHLEKELIDYVVVHELTHFIEPNHSSRFYLEMSKRMPDYKERQNKLKEKHI